MALPFAWFTWFPRFREDTCRFSIIHVYTYICILRFYPISADLTLSLPALLKVVKLVYSERKQLEKILKSSSIRQQDRVGHLVK